MKKIGPYIAQTVAIALLILSVVFDVNIPFFKEGLISLWIVLTLYFSFIKTPDLQEKRLYLTTQNDSAAKHTNFIMGLFIIIGGALYYYYTKEIQLFLILLMIQSALLIFVYFYKKTETKGLSILIKNQKLHYAIGKIHQEMTLEEIENVRIHKNEIVISRAQKKKNYISFLELKPKEVHDAASFFKQNLDQQLVTIEP
jgi:hypothetical protein